MPMMSGPGSYYSDHGDGWRLARSLVTLAAELQVAFPTAVCLGTKGDSRHQAEATSSDHNPWVAGPDGVGIVRAIDIGGPAKVQQAIFTHLLALYGAHDPRLYFYGYLHKDGIISNWSAAGGTHANPGDEGHLHVSVTQTNGGAPRAGRSGYVAAIDSTAPWGFLPHAVTAALTVAPSGKGDVMVTEAQLTAIIRREIHRDNVRQAAVIVNGTANRNYSAAEVKAITGDKGGVVARVNGHANHVLSRLLYGDGKDVVDSKNTHPVNLRNIWSKVKGNP